MGTSCASSMQGCITKTSGAAISIGLLTTVPAATPFVFSTGRVTNQIATASRPGPASGVNQETESADDFILGSGGAYLHTEGTRPCA